MELSPSAEWTTLLRPVVTGCAGSRSLPRKTPVTRITLKTARGREHEHEPGETSVIGEIGEGVRGQQTS